MGALRERHSVNPFMDSFTAYVQPKKVTVKHATGSSFMNEATGEQFNSVIIEKSEKFEDVGDFIKLKTGAYAMEKLINLSPASYKLLFWAMKNLVYHSDYVTIFGPRAQVEMGYKSINSIYKAVEGLIEAEIIAPKEGGTWLFYINPLIMYKGNMLFLFFQYKLMQEQVKKEPKPSVGYREPIEKAVQVEQIKEFEVELKALPVKGAVEDF